MAWARAVSAAVLLGAAVWIGVLVHDANTAILAAAESGSFPIEVMGPGGTIFNGTVELENATAYRVLAAAAVEGGFEVQVQGSGATLFVVAVAGHANEGAGGWCYTVWDGGWVHPARSAGVQPLADGQASRWTFEDAGCDTLA